MLRVVALVILSSFAFLSVSPAAQRPRGQLLSFEERKIGKNDTRLEIPFVSDSGARLCSLRVAHLNVLQPCQVEMNGRRVGELSMSYRTERDSYLDIPADAVKRGSNVLTFLVSKPHREISIKKTVLFTKPLRELMQLRTVAITVKDHETGSRVPARVTIVDLRGGKPNIFNLSSGATAVREGLIYTTGEKTTFELAEGEYVFYATRGMEWGMDRKKVSVEDNKANLVELEISRQVRTEGYIAADTHVHTLTFSGHGDATVQERMVTLAGEGVELAVATDHNHQTDYAPYQTQLGLNEFFTPVTGNEVTTRNGHLIGFPMPPGGKTPDFQETDWVKLVADIRLKGAKIVILNHPRYPDPEKNPLKKFGFNRASGDRFNGPAFTFNAMELVNASSPSTVARPEEKTDPTRLLTDWIAIQNRGEKILGVGASDSHEANTPVGQGRTYIQSSTDDPSRLDVNQLCESFLAGKTCVSYGIFAEVKADGHGLGEFFSPASRDLEVVLRVATSNWIRPRRAIVFLNGIAVAERKLQPISGEPYDETQTFRVKVPEYDAWLTCAVFGDGVTEPYWETLADFTAAVTNPIYLDGNADGKYQSPRDTARSLLPGITADLDSTWAALSKADDALVGQMLGLIYLQRDAAFLNGLTAKLKASADTRPIFKLFLEELPRQGS